MGSILNSLTNGVNVNDSATGTPNTIVVTLRNLSINAPANGTNGINFTSGKTVNVENCQIQGNTAAASNGDAPAAAQAPPSAPAAIRPRWPVIAGVTTAGAGPPWHHHSSHREG